ncbi:alpha/beta hydrolase [Gordonia insulae]|uniref:DUF1023 domain-containing protein n=1 Tax=Gordonia insulae TaxID=2420509 RepID=A0A3G8JU18_9ACTN|nr:alpha/beta hydrolase [Gordonia insulae]AZG48032.1 hypothetical protein D7316_04645 [Gordonia insulae]
MRPTISELRAWRPLSIDAAGVAAQEGATALDDAMDAAARAMEDAVHWLGAARNTLAASISQERDHASRVRNVLLQIADEADDAGADLAHARDVVLRDVDAAVAAGFVVSDTGEVTPGNGPGDGRAFEARIGVGLTTLDELDETYGSRLDALGADLAAMVDRQPDVALPGGQRRNPDDVVTALRDLSPSQRRNLLSNMTSTDRRRVMQAAPQIIGNLDGVDFDTRAEANEITIRTALADERRAGRGAGPRARALEGFLERRRDPHGADGTEIERRFIAFQNTPNGRFIEMIGGLRPGTRNATVHVPGTRSNLNGSQDESDSAWELAHRTGGPVFLYVDGDLPQRLGHEGLRGALGAGAAGGPLAQILGLGAVIAGSVDDSAVDTEYAREMAPRLVAFGGELDTEIALHAPCARTTFVGHSYGGSVVGSAEQLGLRADRVIYASSAGTGVFDGPWRNANPDVERYSLTAPGDPIQYVQSLPGNPHGHDPDVAPGVIRMDTGRYGPHNPDHPGGLVAGVDAHGDYWSDPESTAFRNMVAVITGAEPTTYVDRGPDRPATVEVEHAVDDVKDVALEVGQELLKRTVGPLADLLDGDIDLPGPIPDIPLRIPW